jgi:FkbM family methyltransferase
MLKLNLSPFSDILFENAGLHNTSGLNLCIENPTAGNMGFRLKESEEKGLISTSIDSLMLKYQWDKIDLVKIDIEGSEEQVFSTQFDWLSRTRYLVMELHDHYAPNASTNLIRALSNFEIELKWRGENLICKFKQKEA